ncbi:glycosyltransferase family 8 protein, partial [Periconia macrospinosa]
ELAHVKSKYAFATFLSGKEDAKLTDPYFIAVRTLTYQLLYANETRSRDQTIPFVVLCTDKVPLEQRKRLQRDGAIVVVAESITSDWATTSVANWQGILTKLRLWELTQFERIALLDGDTILTQPLDAIFNDPAVSLQETQLNKTDPNDPVIKPDERALPPTYAFAAVTEMKAEHAFPPSRENNDFPNYNYFNAGFFVFKPSLDMLAYYLSVLDIPDRFNPDMQEQNLLNYAHRREGAMSWMLLENTWNIHFPRWEDVQGGVKSIHDKWWDPLDDRLKDMMVAWRWRMEGFFEMRD